MLPLWISYCAPSVCVRPLIFMIAAVLNCIPVCRWTSKPFAADVSNSEIPTGRRCLLTSISSMLPMKSPVPWRDTLQRSRSGSPEREDAPHHELTPRTMEDSYCEHTLRFASSPELLEKYTNTSGGIRTGKLMEHLDSLAGSIAYKHMLGPVDSIGNVTELGFYLVTASVDRCVWVSHSNTFPNASSVDLICLPT